MPKQPTRRATLVGAAGLVVGAANPAVGQAGKPSGARLIFFDHGQSVVTETAKKIVTQIVTALVRQNSRVTVSGFCDTSEEAPDKLGMDRAVAVLREFASADLPKRVQLTAVSRATTPPLVKTGPNVREPQNRRVEIVVG